MIPFVYQDYVPLVYYDFHVNNKLKNKRYTIDTNNMFSKHLFLRVLLNMSW